MMTSEIAQGVEKKMVYYVIAENDKSLTQKIHKNRTECDKEI